MAAGVITVMAANLKYLPGLLIVYFLVATVLSLMLSRRQFNDFLLPTLFEIVTSVLAAKYVAAIFSDPDGSWWSRPEFFVEDNGQPSQGMLVPALPGRCVWLKQAHNGVGYFFRYNVGFVGCF